MYDAKSDQQLFPIDDSFENVEEKQMIALKDLDGISIESEEIEAIGNRETYGSGWDRIYSASIDLFEDVIKIGSSYIKKKILKFSSVFNNKNKNEIFCRS